MRIEEIEKKNWNREREREREKEPEAAKQVRKKVTKALFEELRTTVLS